jgi:hypothetical protein
MPVQAEIHEHPGLQDLLAEEAQRISDTDLMVALKAFRRTPGVINTPIGRSLDEAVFRQAETADEAFGWWDAVRRWLRGEDDRVVDQMDEPVELEAYWLTVPNVSHAKVTVSSSPAKSNEPSASLTIAGIGGGPTLTLALKEDVKFDAAETERVVLTTTGTFELVRVTRNGAVVTTYPRLCALDRANFGWTRRRASPPDPASVGPARSSRTFDASASGGTTTDTLTLTRGTIWEFGAEVGIAKLGLKAKVGGKITYERDVGYT